LSFALGVLTLAPFYEWKPKPSAAIPVRMLSFP
jgi:hypothetical protein